MQLLRRYMNSLPRTLGPVFNFNIVFRRPIRSYMQVLNTRGKVEGSSLLCAAAESHGHLLVINAAEDMSLRAGSRAEDVLRSSCRLYVPYHQVPE